MSEVTCRCGETYEVANGSRFCSDCGSPLPLTRAELVQCAGLLTALHSAVFNQVAQLTGVEIVIQAGETAWTRIDELGFSIVAWLRDGDATVQSIETSPLRNGGFSLLSTAAKDPAARHTIATIDELPRLIPTLLPTN